LKISPEFGKVTKMPKLIILIGLFIPNLQNLQISSTNSSFFTHFQNMPNFSKIFAVTFFSYKIVDFLLPPQTVGNSSYFPGTLGLQQKIECLVQFGAGYKRFLPNSIGCFRSVVLRCFSGGV
jgi:hypothetical protein